MDSPKHSRTHAKSSRGGSLSRRGCLSRRGSLIVEAAISVALLGTALYGLSQLARTASDLNQHSDQRLAATLAAENTLERLRREPWESLQQEADDVAESMTDQSGCEITIQAESCSIADRPAIHLRVDAAASPGIRVTLHQWRTDSPADSSSKQAGADADTEADDGEPDENSDSDAADPEAEENAP